MRGKHTLMFLSLSLSLPLSLKINKVLKKKKELLALTTGWRVDLGSEEQRRGRFGELYWCQGWDGRGGLGDP